MFLVIVFCLSVSVSRSDLVDLRNKHMNPRIVVRNAENTEQEVTDFFSKQMYPRSSWLKIAFYLMSHFYWKVMIMSRP